MNILYLYYVLMSISFGISIFCLRGALKNIFIFTLLLVSILVEVTVRFYLFQNENHFFLYHFFTPVEYMLLALYCRQTTQFKRLRILIDVSIVSFWMLSLYTFSGKLHSFPSISNSIESLLLIILATIILLTIEPVIKMPVTALAEFWIVLAILVYFTGTFFFNGAYNYLRMRDANHAKEIFNVINSVFNCIFYILLSYGLICYYRFRKLS